MNERNYSAKVTGWQARVVLTMVLWVILAGFWQTGEVFYWFMSLFF